MPLETTSPALNTKLKGWKGGALTLLLLLLTFFEGNKLAAYRDIAGVLTICQGITSGVYPGEVVTESQCDQMNKPRAQQSLDEVESVVKVPMSDTTHAALASFDYNVGFGAFRKSSVLQKLNAGDGKGGCAEIALYYCYGVEVGTGEKTPGKLCYVPFVPAHGKVKAKGWDHKYSKGLATRHLLESQVCLQGLAG